MDWLEFAKELSEEGFFDLCGETPQNLTDDEIASYGGLQTYAQIQAQIEANEFASKRAKVLERIGNRDTLSFSLLKDIDAIRNPRPEFGDKSQRFSFGKYFEQVLCGLTITETPSEDEASLAQKMVVSSLENINLKNLLQYHYTKFQTERSSVISGLRIKGVADLFLEGALNLVNYGADLKTTSAKTQAAFEKDCVKWGYFTQAYIYMEVFDISVFWIFGVSKKNCKVFELEISQSDFDLGKQEFERLISNLDYFGVRQKFEVK